MKLSDHLSEQQRKQLNKIKLRLPNHNTKTSNKKKENLSYKDFENLMGAYRDTYKRGKGGAIRRK